MSAVEKKELIKILKTDIGAEELNSVNSRELYEFLGKSTGGKPSKEYIVTLDMAKELCMVSIVMLLFLLVKT